MATTEVRTSTGHSFAGLLFITFLVLKLTGVIGWSWWWVTAPLWVAATITCILFAGTVAVMAWVERSAPKLLGRFA